MTGKRTTKRSKEVGGSGVEGEGEGGVAEESSGAGVGEEEGEDGSSGSGSGSGSDSGDSDSSSGSGDDDGQAGAKSAHGAPQSPPGDYEEKEGRRRYVHESTDLDVLAAALDASHIEVEVGGEPR